MNEETQKAVNRNGMTLMVLGILVLIIVGIEAILLIDNPEIPKTFLIILMFCGVTLT